MYSSRVHDSGQTLVRSDFPVQTDGSIGYRFVLVRVVALEDRHGVVKTDEAGGRAIVIDIVKIRCASCP